MKILRDEKRKITVEEKNWKRVKDVVDEIFAATQTVRDKMTDNLEQFRGNLWDEDKLEKIGGKLESSAVVNLFYMIVESIAPMLSDNKPIANLTPRLPFLEQAAISYNNFIKYEWDALEMQMALYRGTLDAMIMKLGIFEFGYDETKQNGGQSCVTVVDPRCYFCAPGYEDNWKAPLQGVVEDLPLSWVRANFPNIKNVTPTAHVQGNDAAKKVKAFKYGDAEDFELENYFTKVYRVWMRDHKSTVDYIQKDDQTGEQKTISKKAYPYGKVMYFTEKEYLGTRACTDAHGLPPYVTMVSTIDPHNLLGIDENQQIEGLNKELQLQFQAMTGHARRHHNPNKIVDTGLGLDPEKVENTFDIGGQTYTKDSTYENKGPGIEFVDHPLIDPAVPQLLNMIPEMVDKVSGSTETARGEISKKERQSATELGILVDTSHTRTRQKIRNQEVAITRCVYLMCCMAQQYYVRERPIHWKESGSDNTIYDTFASTRVRLRTMLEDAIEAEGITQYKPKDNSRENLTEDQLRAIDDYEQFCKNFGKGKELDPILFDFDIEIQTNSTLPVDKQSQANLALRLFALKVIDRQAVLETLGFPNWRAIIDRINAQQEQMMAAKNATGQSKVRLPSGPAPGNQLAAVGG
jgi:hypothetical protein